jgi:hypothetical protein
MSMNGRSQTYVNVCITMIVICLQDAQEIVRIWFEFTFEPYPQFVLHFVQANHTLVIMKYYFKCYDVNFSLSHNHVNARNYTRDFLCSWLVYRQIDMKRDIIEIVGISII